MAGTVTVVSTSQQSTLGICTKAPSFSTYEFRSDKENGEHRSKCPTPTARLQALQSIERTAATFANEAQKRRLLSGSGKCNKLIICIMQCSPLGPRAYLSICLHMGFMAAHQLKATYDLTRHVLCSGPLRKPEADEQGCRRSRQGAQGQDRHLGQEAGAPPGHHSSAQACQHQSGEAEGPAHGAVTANGMQRPGCMLSE